MGLIIPFITIGNGGSTGGVHKLRPTLITSGFHPPILVGKTPASPFSHAILVRITHAGNTRIVDRPSGRGRLGPDSIACQRLIDIGTERQAVEVLGEEDVVVGHHTDHFNVVNGPPPVVASIQIAER